MTGNVPRVVVGTVTRHEAFGFFVDFGADRDGLVMLTMIVDDLTVPDPDFPSIGSSVRAVLYDHSEVNGQPLLSTLTADFRALEVQVPVRAVRVLADAWDPSDNRAKDALITALDEMPLDATLSCSSSGVQPFITIYRRRALRRPDVPGTVDLLHGLERLSEPRVLMTTLEAGDRMIFIWLNERMSALVGCVASGAGESGRSDESSFP